MLGVTITNTSAEQQCSELHDNFALICHSLQVLFVSLLFQSANFVQHSGLLLFGVALELTQKVALASTCQHSHLKKHHHQNPTNSASAANRKQSSVGSVSNCNSCYWHSTGHLQQCLVKRSIFAHSSFTHSACTNNAQPGKTQNSLHTQGRAQATRASMYTHSWQESINYAH